MVKKNINELDVIKEYLSGDSTIQVGEKFGCSHNCINMILRKHGIKRRTKKEANEKYAKYNVCIICKKKFRARLNYTDTTGLNKKTCSKECNSKLMSQIQTGETNSNWKDGASQVRYQRIRREIKPDICEWCGAEHPTRIDTHHIDRNKSNNSMENILVLCASCHAYLHYVEDDRGLRGWNPKCKRL